MNSYIRLGSICGNSLSFRRYGGLLILCGGIVLSIASWSATDEKPDQSVPAASCGPGDRTESVQGQTTLAERFAAGSAKAYNCNLELIGEFEGEGTSGYMSVFENCVYYSTWQNSKMRHPGVAVLDVSDSRKPGVTTYLDGPSALNANEFLEIDNARGLLFVSKFNSTSLEVYDLSADCRHPLLMKSTTIPGVILHAGQFAPDNRTLYGATCCKEVEQYPYDPTVPAYAVFAVDTSDPFNPHAIATWIPPKHNWYTHAVSINRDGTRAYASLSLVNGSNLYGSGLAVLDVGDIQSRRPNAHFRVVSTLFWDDASNQEFALPIHIKQRPYLIVTDISATLNQGRFPPPSDACTSRKPGWGFARIIDISDENHPRIASKLMLEADTAERCSSVIHDPTAVFGYGSLACNVDVVDDATLLACGYNEAGLRVFDIRDPAHPKEIAYYKPSARRTESHPGSVVRDLLSPELSDHTADDVWLPIFRNGGGEIWFITTDSGFQVVRFTDRFKASHKELFPH